MGREEIMRGETQDTSGHNEKILVSIRLRPLNEKENTRNDISEWECIDNTTIICKHNLTERSMFPSAYTFDRVFGCDCPTKQVYEEGAKEVAVSALGGINASIFAYGQTSSGKTYTMSGITKYAIADIFEYMEKRKDREFVLKFSAMEIYNEAVRDLLSSDSTPLRLLDDPERGTVVERLTEEALRDRCHLEELLSICEAQRQIGETSLNETSSRSHQILRLTIESSAQKSSSLAANLNFVDLAGSERASQTLSAGARLKEGCHINRSLLTLGTVIRKLSKGRTGHIPYRDSKLTRILQNSLGGNARTAIICTMSPARSHVEQSRNTLFFASCAKQVTTNAQVNLVVSDKILVRQLQRELARMENELRNLESGSITSDSAALLREKEQLMEKEQLIEKMDKQIKELTWQRDMAQSRVENLLRSVGEDRLSKTDEYAENGSSNIANPPRLDAEFGSCNGAKDLDTPTIIDSDKPSLELPENSEDNFLLDDSTPKFGGPDPCQGWEEIAGRGTREEAEAICEEVPCVEKEESIVRTKAEVDVLSSTSTEKEEKLSLTWETKETESSPQKEDKESSRNDIDDTYDALKEKVKEMQKTIHYLVNLQCQEQSPFSETYSPSCGSFKLTRSRSCRESLINIPSPLWFEKVEQKGNTSPVVYEKDHIRRRTGSSSKLPELKYTASTGPFSRKASQTSLSSMEEESTISTFSMDAHSNKESYAENTPDMHDVIPGPNGMASFLLEGAQNKEEPAIETINHIDHFFAAQNEKTKLQPENAQSIGESGVENIINRDHFVARLNDMCQPQSDKQSSDDSCHKSANEEAAAPETNESQESINGIGLETVQCALKTHTDWASEFERQRGEIMALWAICSVPLVHRTYFYLLFKGDPSDSVYMEVELRRLSFLKSTFSQGSNASRRDSVKALNRERDMLAKQIPKKFSRKDREFLYKKWGINLNTKQRSLQLANCLWTDTNDINHVNESANLVSKLVGLVEASQTPKEMFGLSFLPKSPSWRTFSWKNNLPSLV